MFSFRTTLKRLPFYKRTFRFPRKFQPHQKTTGKIPAAFCRLKENQNGSQSEV